MKNPIFLSFVLYYYYSIMMSCLEDTSSLEEYPRQPTLSVLQQRFAVLKQLPPLIYVGTYVQKSITLPCLTESNTVLNPP